MLKNNLPHELLTLPNKCKLIIFFDENGSASALSRIHKDIERGKNIDENIRYFTLTSCIYKRSDYLQNECIFKKIKKTYFENNMSIVFHTRDIKKENGPFKFCDENTRKRFITDLSDSIEKK